MPSIRTTAPAISNTEISKVTVQDADAHAWNILSTGEGDMNLKLIGGNAANVGSGAASTGTLRTILATDDLLVVSTGLVGSAPSSTRRFVTAGIAETTFPTAVDDGNVVDLLHDEYGRPWIKGYDPGSASLLVTDISPASMQKLGPITFTQLTAAGSTAATNISNYSTICYQIVVAAINTSVTVRVEGSHDNSNWFNLDDGGVDTTYTANGTYQLSKYGVCCKYIRFTFVSEVGGTAVTLDAQLMAGLE